MKFLLLFSLIATALSALNLDEAQERAQQYAPQLQIARGEIQVAQSEERVAWATYHPVIGAGFNWQYTRNTTAFTFSPVHRYNLTADYNLFRGFSDSAAIDARKADTRAKKFARKASEADLKLAVAQAYSECLKAEKTLTIQQEQLASLQRQYHDTEARFEQGIIAKNDLLLIDVDRLRAQQAVVQARSAIKQTRSRLNQLLAGHFSAAEKLEDLNVTLPEPPPFDTMLQDAYANRSELKAQEQVREAILYERKAVTGNYLPHVDLHGEYTLNDQERYLGTSLIQPQDQLVGIVNVSWTLYAGLSNIERRKSLMIQAQNQALQYAQMKLDLRYQLTEAYEAYKVAHSARDVARRAQQSAQENFRITNDRYRYGQVDTLTLLVAQSNLTEATNGYNNAYYDLFVAYTALERIAGE